MPPTCSPRPASRWSSWPGKYHCLPVAIVLNLPERLCQERNRARADRDFGPHVVRQQRSQLRRSLRGLGREGFRHVFVLESAEEVEAATVERVPLWNDRRHEHGPFDIIGDVHGCCDELEELLEQLGLSSDSARRRSIPVWGEPAYAHPEGRKAVFVGDLVDRGPRVLDTVRLVRNMVVARLGPVRARQPRHEAAARSSAARTCRSRTAWPSRWPRSTPCPTKCGSRSARSWPSSSTAWSATTSSTTASWSSPTPG